MQCCFIVLLGKQWANVSVPTGWGAKFQQEMLPPPPPSPDCMLEKPAANREVFKTQAEQTCNLHQCSGDILQKKGALPERRVVRMRAVL